ncbi:uncharacterized protein LOC128867248 [Anastrepha ludens]|uniref:uncharacterized protein LOC128867248 n=1 Tax=Anastrepha ludens TaxID=28586 RepID=UPI0023AE896B|nr:uncharacterized protein LOC128867248 [Anastrepha ludens]
MSTTELWFDDSSDDERLVELARSRKQLRDASYHLEMASTEFLKNFRLSKEPFVNLLSSTENQLQQCTRAKLIPNILRLAIVLRHHITHTPSGPTTGLSTARPPQKHNPFYQTFHTGEKQGS